MTTEEFIQKAKAIHVNSDENTKKNARLGTFVRSRTENGQLMRRR